MLALDIAREVETGAGMVMARWPLVGGWRGQD